MDELIRTAYIRGPLGPRGPQGPVGPKGEQGPIGLKGDKGDTGPMGPGGPRGIKGETGQTGPQGPKGEQGPKGDPFTYEDFTAAQLEALRGPQGPLGILGIQGIQGEQGPAGQDGRDGADGQDGAPGLDGAPGQDGHTPVITALKNNGVTTISVDGTTIATINDGLDGQNGRDGQNGTNGTNGTNGSDGVTPHIDSTTGNWFIGITDTGVHAQGPAGSDATNTDESLKTTSVSTNVTYYPVLGNNTSTAENKYIDSFGIKYNYNSASGQNGNSTLTLGNATASPDSSSRYGRLALYGTGSHCSTITSGNPTSDRSITFPDASGTVALIWTGTQAQYDLLTPDDNTIYIITPAS